MSIYKKKVESFFTLVKKIPLLASNVYKACLFYILNILFAYKVYFFGYKNYNIGSTVISRCFQFHT